MNFFVYEEFGGGEGRGVGSILKVLNVKFFEVFYNLSLGL